jgi:hypothetical protein
VPPLVALAGFGSVDLAALRWVRAADSPMVFRLSSGDRPLLELRWAERTGSLARAETASDRWTLKRGGFLNPNVTLRAGESRTELARISVHLNHHSIRFTGGRSYRFHRAGVLVPAWQVTTDDGQELAHIEPVREGRKLSGGAVLVSADGRACQDIAALIVLTWYFIVLAWFEDETLVPFEELDGV